MTFTNNGLNFTECDVTFNWDPTDVDGSADPNNFILGKLDGVSWTQPVVSARTATSLSVLDLNSFSEFQIGESSECIVNIPNASFKAALIANLAINTNNDDEIQCRSDSLYR